MEKLNKAFLQIKQKIDGFKPDIGIVLGSGFDSVADLVTQKYVVPYKDINDFPSSTVHGHKGQFVFGTLCGVNIAIMRGRVHYYEGYDIKDVVLPVRVLALLGIKAILLTNAAGGVNPNFCTGSLMAIKDHIMLNVPNPLIGENFSALGVRFPDMTACYDKQLISALKTAAKKQNLLLEEGVYYMVSGPSFETPAEIKLISTVGGDAVGMSTAPEAVVMHHAGVRVCGLSLITNMAAGISKNKLSHEEVNQTADKEKEKLGQFICQAIKEIFEEIK